MHMSTVRLLLIGIFILVGPMTDLQASEIGTLGEYGIRHVTAPQAAELIDTQKELVILDVRTRGNSTTVMWLGPSILIIAAVISPR